MKRKGMAVLCGVLAAAIGVAVTGVAARSTDEAQTWTRAERPDQASDARRGASTAPDRATCSVAHAAWSGGGRTITRWRRSIPGVPGGWSWCSGSTTTTDRPCRVSRASAGTTRASRPLPGAPVISVMPGVGHPPSHPSSPATPAGSRPGSSRDPSRTAEPRRARRSARVAAEVTC